MSNTGTSSAALYGTDVRCVGGMDPGMAEVSGSFLVLQSAVNRLNMKRGACIDSPNDGLDLCAWLSKDVTPHDIARLKIEIPAELEKDQRIVSAQVVTAIFNAATHVLTISIRVFTADGPFTLTLAVSSVSVTLLGIV